MKMVILILGVIFSVNLSAQTLYNVVQSCKQEAGVSQSQRLEESDLERKCGTMDIDYLVRHESNISLESKNSLLNARSRPILQKTLVSPKGYFRIHYDTSGINTPAFEVNEVAIAADSSYTFQVITLGFLPPPSDGSAGGDNRYDIYIVDLGYYGVTTMETEVTVGSKRYTSFIMIDQDFAEVKTKGLPGAQVTVAHEFHHAIQAGAYKFDSSVPAERFFYEMTSTSMEEFVYDSVNDYYFYLPSYFRNPNRTFRDMTGYEMAHWNIHLTDELSISLIKRQWELFVTNDALSAMYISLTEANYPFNLALKDFALKNIFTGVKTNSAYFHEEGRYYPRLTPTMKSSYTPSEKLFTTIVSPTGYAILTVENTVSNDSITFALVNYDIASVLNGKGQAEIVVNLLNYKAQGSVQLNNYYFATVSVEKPDVWFVIGEINGEVFDTQISHQGSAERSVYPSPYNYSMFREIPITFSFLLSEPKEVELSVVSVAGELMYKGMYAFDTAGAKEIRWKPINETGEELSSGVYLYVLTLPGSTVHGKFVVVK